ncbi:MAG: hypothetical protein JWM10_863 [Myxococcaceae bacterium]|nr:hypothetical protein [Myxococcaceae bacterium]
MRRLLLLLAPVVAGSQSVGCAALTGVLALGGSLPSTSSHESVTPLGARERRSEITAELEPLKVRCVQRERAARERVRLDTHGIDTVGRITYGFIAVGEAAIASATWFGATRDESPSVGLGVLASILSVDAIATMVLAFALPNYHRVTESERAGTWRATVGCPADLRITYAGRALPVGADGRLQPADEAWLLTRWITVGAAAEIGVGARVQPLAPTAEQRCVWARLRGLPEAAALCPRPTLAPQFVPSPMTAAPSPMGVQPLQVTIDLGVAVP